MDTIPLVMSRPLPREAITEGHRLIEALENADFPVVAALWLWDEESRSWQFLVASPLYDREGPLRAHALLRTIRVAMEPPLAIDPLLLSVRSPEDRLVLAFRDEIRMAAESGDTVLEGARIGDQYIDAVYIYQLPVHDLGAPPLP